jgi:DNA-binding MarR family transcriptional regulator
MQTDLMIIEKGLAVITRIFSDVEIAFLRRIEASGLTARQMRYLDTINALGNPSPSEIAKALKLKKPSVTALIVQLEALGILRKVDSDTDRRGYHVHLTEKAMEFCLEHDAVHKRLAAVLIDGLDSTERVEFCNLIDKVAERLGKNEKV